MSDELYLCAYVAEFPAQALLRMRPELRSKPVAVMDGEAPFQQVCSLNKFARSLGVVTGMSRTEMDSFPSVALLKRSLAEEQSSRAALLECAGKFSPRLEEKSSEQAFICVLDIAGTEKLFGDPQTLALRAQEAFTAMEVSGSIAVSANFETAVCLAKGSSGRKVPIVICAGAERQALSPLPLSVLGISAEYAETFEEWGVSTLGVLAMLPEKDLIARLGQHGKRLRLLARGEAPHLLQPIEPVRALEEQIELEMPVEILDSLLFGVSLMLEQLLTRARERIVSLAVVISELGLEGGGVHTRLVRPALPSNDKQLWLKLLHLDWIAHPPPAAVISMKLKAETGVTGKVQLGLFSPQLPEPGRLDVTLARIRAVVGEERSGSVELKDTHEPDGFRMKEFSVAGTGPPNWVEPQLPAAVMRRLRPPERISVTLRNRRPHIFYFHGVAYQAESSYGPWRCAGGWWSQSQWSMEEWDVVARRRNKNFGECQPPAHRDGLLCCCITRDVIRDQWLIEALYD
jgi:protein ImuB